MEVKIHMNIKNKIVSNILVYIKNPMIGIVGIAGSLFSIIEMFEYFGFDFLGIFNNSYIDFFMIVIILYLIGLLLNEKINDEKPNAVDNKQVLLTRNGDSILELLARTMKMARYKEVVQIGEALRKSSCLKNDHTLRIDIGCHVQVAANQCGDMNQEAIALIDDIGNTYLQDGHVKKAIENINKGINIIKKKIDSSTANNEQDLDEVYYIAVRGYRNLANCYSKNKKIEDATRYIDEACAYIEKISDEEIKLRANGTIEYAKGKKSRTDKKIEDAICHIEKSIEYFNALCIYKDTEDNRAIRNESVIKNYRELGDLYRNVKNIDKAQENLNVGYAIAKEYDDHDNCVTICLIQAEIAMGYTSKHTNKNTSNDPLSGVKAKDAISRAELSLRYIDTQRILDHYERVVGEYKELYEKGKNN